MDKIYYGVAYYREYLPEERLDKDIKLMLDAGINYVRIAESTWSTFEKQEGVFDFSSILIVLDKMYQNNIDVIIGTPTYAIPAWLEKKYPEVMAITPNGRNKYGHRQKMDITHPAYLFYAERLIRKLMQAVANHPAVIGFQIDNETKYYDVCGDNIQIDFVKYLKEKFAGDLLKLNHEFGLDYWSNRIDAWEDFPSTVGTINASLGAEFQKFQRKLVKKFLQWQANIINEYKSEKQFLTHNFDFEWRTWSYGIQSEVNHFDTSEILDITGVDVYHPSQDQLTGIEIAFSGDVARSTKKKNYLVLETQAQAFKNWTPYPGQLRLQAYSHIASGASLIGYWHWHSIHNSFETYWKGILSHDLQPNPIYEEASIVGNELKILSKHLREIKKYNRVAIIVSNECLTAIDWHPWHGHQFNRDSLHQYNDIFRAYYDTLYKMNIEVDILSIDDDSIFNYDLLIIPLLYSVSDLKLEQLNNYVLNGGNVIYSFKSGFANENMKVRTVVQPGIISKACGISYQLFVEPNNVSLISDEIDLANCDCKINDWMELIEPDVNTKILAKYQHPYWGKYAAVTSNRYGRGSATYIGCNISTSVLQKIYEYIFNEEKLADLKCQDSFPLIIKNGINYKKEKIRFYFNYSSNPINVCFTEKSGLNLLTGSILKYNDKFVLKDWDLAIILLGTNHE